MKWRLTAPGIALVCLLAGCEREPRSQSFFEANEAERSQVIADCQIGAHRGEECQLAQLADQAVAVKQRHARRQQILRDAYEAEPTAK